MRRRFVAGAILATLSAAGARSETMGQIACEFPAGTAGLYEGGAYQSRSAEALSFSVTDIDLDGQSARIVIGGQAAAVTSRAIRAIGAIHILEVANEGFLNVTTIYDVDPLTGVRPAVHSRHLGIVGQPVFAQYTGTCRARS